MENGRCFCCLVNGHQNQGAWHVLARVYSAKNRNAVGTVENPSCVLNVDSFLDSCEKTTEVEKMQH